MIITYKSFGKQLLWLMLLASSTCVVIIDQSVCPVVSIVTTKERERERKREVDVEEVRVSARLRKRVLPLIRLESEAPDWSEQESQWCYYDVCHQNLNLLCSSGSCQTLTCSFKYGGTFTMKQSLNQSFDQSFDLSIQPTSKCTFVCLRLLLFMIFSQNLHQYLFIYLFIFKFFLC